MKKVVHYLILLSEVIVAISLLRGLVSNLKARNKLKDLRVRKRNLVEEQENLRQRIEKTKNKGYLEYVAREKLNLVKDGEVLVIVGKEGDKNKAGRNNDGETRRKNWEKWRRVVLGW